MITRHRRRIPLATATNGLVAINVLAYIWETATGAFTSDYALVAHGAIYGPLVTHGEWWRVVTGAFLHAGLLHISLNMFALWQVGTFLEMLVGGPRMLLIYFVSMLGSGAAVVEFNYNEVTVGASGAIFGIFGALVAIGLRLGRRGRGLVQQTLPIILINLAIGFSIPNISSVGHLGGLFSGFLAGLALLMLHQAPESPARVSAFADQGEALPAPHDARAADTPALTAAGEEEETHDAASAPDKAPEAAEDPPQAADVRLTADGP